MKNKLLALLIIISLLLTSCIDTVVEESAPEPAEPVFRPEQELTAVPPPPDGRRTIHFNDMPYERPDVEAVLEEIKQLTEQLKTAPDFDAVLLLEREVSLLIEQFSTLYALSYIRKDLDMTDDYYEIELRFLNDAQVDISLTVSEFIRELVEGEFADEYRELVGGYYFDGLVRSMLYECESVADYKKELASLYVDYEAMIFSLAVEHDGMEFNYNDTLFAHWFGMDFLMESYLEQYLEMYVEMYARIIELYKLIAFELGFDCAAEMLYYLRFNRDYTPAEAMQMFDNVKKYIVPLTPLLLGHEESPSVYRLRRIIDAIPEVLGEVDAELAEVWDFMITYGVYDFEPLPEKAVTGYMINLPAYDTPFIFTYWNHDFSGAYTILHEFGHFYDDWLRFSPDYNGYTLLDLDSSEFYADGMAMILWEQYAALSNQPEIAQNYMVYNIIYNSIIMQSVFEEFQLRAFGLDEINADTLGLLYAELFIEYGFETDFTGIPLSKDTPYHDWLRISHFFYMPFYTVSYVTSSVALMQLWEVAERDIDSAVEIYLRMIRGDQSMFFSELLESVSLRSPKEPGALRSIAAQAERFLR